MTLAEYLQGEKARQFKWGECDCATLAIGWLDNRLGKAALRLWRGWYSDAESCEAFIASAGGFNRLATAFIRNQYALELAKPKIGNVVLAELQFQHVMGLRVNGDLIAFRTVRGLRYTRRATTLAEWG